ncbi:hypothetical protein KZ870_36650, partial [Pseudomonas aeruginosa]|nr:hypothetical protein [Pseudomonas aeruginosa]
AKKSMITTLEKEGRIGNGGVNIDNNTTECHLMPDSFLGGGDVLTDIKLKSNYEVFKTTRGMSLSSLGEL